MEKRYIQLWSVRDELDKDFKGTLEKLAKMGYTGVEFAAGNFGGMEAPELKAFLEGLQLEPLGAHITTPNVADFIAYAKALGLKYIVDPYKVMATKEEALAFAKELNEAGALCRAQGIKFGYHNHAHEFVKAGAGEDTLMDVIITHTNPDDVFIELDCGWVYEAGVDPVWFIDKYAGRFKLIHVKENKEVPAKESPIAWANIVQTAIKQGTAAFVLERENLYADVFTCVAEDCAFLKTL